MSNNKFIILLTYYCNRA